MVNQVEKTGQRIFLEGNATLLNEYLQHATNEPGVRVCCFGSNYALDVLATEKLNKKL